MEPITIKVNLTPFYNHRWKTLRKELGLSNTGLVQLLIDTYYLEDTKSLLSFRARLSERIQRGIGYSYLSSLRTISAYINHFLKKINYE